MTGVSVIMGEQLESSKLFILVMVITCYNGKPRVIFDWGIDTSGSFHSGSTTPGTPKSGQGISVDSLQTSEMSFSRLRPVAQ